MRLIQKVAYGFSKHATPASPGTTEKPYGQSAMGVPQAQIYDAPSYTPIPRSDRAEWARKVREALPAVQQTMGAGAGIGHIIQNRNKMMQTHPFVQSLPGILGTPTPGVTNPTKSNPVNGTKYMDWSNVQNRLKKSM